MTLGVRDYIFKLTVRYIAALLIIGVAAFACRMLVQDSQGFTSEFASVINVAGKQRMLSQRIAKASHYLSTNHVLAPDARQELKEALELWSLSHESLQRGQSPSSGVLVGLSEKNKRLFNQIQFSYRNIYTHASVLLESDGLGAQDKENALSVIRVNEGVFLSIMDDIVKEFEHQAQESVAFEKTVDIVLIVFICVVFIALPTLVFRPVLKQLFSDFIDYRSASRETSQLRSQYQDVLEQNKALELTLASIDRAIPVLTYTVDTSLKFTGCNERFANFFGLESSGAIKGLNHFNLTDVVKEFVGEVEEDRSVIEAGMELANQLRTYSNARGENFNFIASKNVLRDQSGKTAGVIAVYLDVSERIKLEGQLAQAGKLEAIGQLAAGVAHEINTPLQYISDNTLFLQQEMSNVLEAIKKTRDVIAHDESHQELRKELEELDIEYLAEELPPAIDQSIQGIQSVRNIVKSMKEFSHPENDETQDIDVNHIVLSSITLTINEWKYVAELEDKLAEGLPVVHGNPGKLSQVIVNIIVNASHAIYDRIEQEKKNGMESSGVDKKDKITIETAAVGESVEIRISDTGTGIPAVVQEKIFEPFFTTKGVGKGTGQGLAIAHKIVTTQYGGSLEFETRLGRGTTFIIKLPMARALAA